MKIEKKFIPLILNCEKKWEFRNSTEHEGLYEIEGEYFLLELRWPPIGPSKIVEFRERVYDGCKKYYICGFDVDKETYKWVMENLDYFKISNGSHLLYIYTWDKVEGEELESWKKRRLIKHLSYI